METLYTVRNCKIGLVAGRYLAIEYHTKHACHVDYPIIYDDLSVAYDNPYALPEYAKKFFEKHAAVLDAYRSNAA